jgi:hypothetical protein
MWPVKGFNPDPLKPQLMHLCVFLLRAQGTAAVAAVLASNHSIYQLSLAGCPLRDEGAMALAEALKTNISLYKLDLSNCMVGGGVVSWAADGVNTLAAQWRPNHGLECTGPGREGVRAFSSCVSLARGLLLLSSGTAVFGPYSN